MASSTASDALSLGVVATNAMAAPRLPVTSRLGWRLLCATWLSMCVLLALPSGAAATVTTVEPGRVLLLFSYHENFPSSARILDGVRSVFGTRGPVLDVEYMDSKRLPDAVTQEHFTHLLAHKLERLPRYDVIMVSDDAALDYALAQRDRLFPGTPVVFLAVNDVAKAVALDADPLVTGVVEQTSPGDTLLLARRLDPALEEVVVVVDGTAIGLADEAALARVREQIRGVRIRTLHLADLSWAELAEALAELPAHRAVLRLATFMDRDGRVLSQPEGIALIADNAPVPVYGLREHDVGAGTIGGVVVDFREQGRQAALMVTQILAGTLPAEVPVLRRSPNGARFDQRLLDRFDIPARRLPPDSIVINRPVSLFEEHAGLVGVTVAVLALLVGFVLYLLWQVVRRHRVERQLRDSEARVRHIIEGTVYGVLIHCDRVPVFVNQAYADLLGYETPAQVLALGSTECLYAPEEHARLRQLQESRRAGEPVPSEYDVIALRRDGRRVVLHNSVHATDWNGRFATQHNVVDVTETRHASDLLRESEERYRTLVENAPEAIVVLDVEAGRFVEANGNACRLFGLSRGQLLQANPAALSPPRQPDGRDSGSAARCYVEQANAGGHPHFEWIHRAADGREIPTEVRLVRLPSASRVLIRGSISDVTERMHTQRELTEKSAQLTATLENTMQGICMIDAELRVVAFNQRFIELLGFPPGRFAKGDLLRDFILFNAERGEYGEGEVEALTERQLAVVAGFKAHRFVRTRPDGTVLDVQGQPVPGGGMVRTYTDITETHRLSQQLSHQARHDALTGLPNRREFEDQLQRMLENAREGTAVHAMCYLDLDQFKVINDTCGHLAGDQLLGELSQTLCAAVRRRDTVARLGGDEFGVLLEDCAMQEAQRVAETLRGVVQEFRFSRGTKSFRIGVSVGLVPITADSGTVTDVLARADAACYAAKDQGRNRIHVYDPGDSELKQRHGEMQSVVHIQNALEDDRFRLYCQPIVPVIRGAGPDGHYELLLRMRDESGEDMRPGVFLPAAERYNLIGRLDRWVVGAALEWLASAAAPPHLVSLCSINLSGQSLADDELLAFIHQRLRKTGVDPTRICFEVTETAAIANLARATRFIHDLKQVGCRFALDDFGSGLSSFAYLKTLPVDFLKIDGLFVKDMVHDPVDRAMVRSINEIGHLMGKLTIAEFVEDDATLAMLQDIGVDYAQGYGIGKPRPIVELLAEPAPARDVAAG